MGANDEIKEGYTGGLVQNVAGKVAPNAAKRGVAVADGPTAPKQTLALDRMLADEGLQFLGMSDDGINPRVLDTKTNKEQTLNVQKMMAGEGIDPNTVSIRFNSPQNALPVSPVSAGDRVLYGTLGDTKSFAAKLKQDFEEVVLPNSQNKLDGIVVKKNGAYHKVDPGFFEGFSAGELGKDLMELGGEQLRGAVEAAFPAGGNVRSSLGRVIGTYNATPTEQLEDEGIELLANAAGLAAPELGKMGGKLVVGLAKWAAPGTTRAISGAAREAFTTTVGFLTRAGRQATETMLDQAPKVAAKIKETFRAAGPAGNVDNVIETLAGQKAKIAGTMLEEAEAALPVQYDKALRNLMQEVGDPTLPMNVGGVARAGMDSIEEMGLGKFVADKSGKRVFMPLSEAEKAAAGAPEWPEETFKEVARIVKTLERYEQDGVLRGTAGAQRLSALNKAINAVSRQAQSSESNAVKAAANKAAASVRGAITEAFQNVGAGEAWAKVNEPYIRFGDTIKAARGLLDSREGVYTFADKLTRSAGKRGSATDMAKDLVELLGSRGKELYNDLLVTNSAMKFAPKAPQMGFAQGVAATGIAPIAYRSPLVALPLAAATAGLSSPRAALTATRAVQGAAKWAGALNDEAASKVLPFARALREQVGSLGAADRTNLLASPAFGAMANEALQGTQLEEQAKQQLEQFVKSNLIK